jgi:hypothetical protein
MIGIEVTRDGQTWLLEDRETVVRMARIGQLGPADKVREEREAEWRPARDVEWLSESFEGDPWDAWEELDGEHPEEIWAACVVPVESEEDPSEDTDVSTRKAALDNERPVAKVEAPVVQSAGPPPKMSLSFQPAAGKKPKAPKKKSPPPRSAKPKRPSLVSQPRERSAQASSRIPPKQTGASSARTMGQIIEFPQGRGGPSQNRSNMLPAALLQPLEVEALVQNDPDAIEVHQGPQPNEPKSWVPWLVVMALVLCLVAFGLSIWTIRLNAGWTSPRTGSTPTPLAVTRPEPLIEPADVDAATGNTSGEDQALVADLDTLTEEIRERIPRTTEDLEGGPDDLSSALLIELSNMRLGPIKVSAPVISWTGAHNDVVEVADIEVRLTTTGNIEEELAAVGLVVGKYLQHYGFQVRKFSVIVAGSDGVSRERIIDPDAARNLWTGRKNLYEFLTGN